MRLVLICIVFCQLNVKFLGAQEIIYKTVDSTLFMPFINAQAYRTKIIDQYFKNANSALDFLPEKYSTDGKEDYTIYLQKAIDNSNILILPDFPILISSIGLKCHSNLKIYFQPNSKLILQANDLESYYALLLDNLLNVELYYPNIEGDRNTHQGENGQWGMGIWLNGSKNIKIFAPHIINCWGDGIFVGSRNGLTPENIQIEDGVIDNNRRNGISIISGKKIIIRATCLSNSIGHNPQSGLDIEPNNNYNVLENIELDSLTTFNNGWNGIIISIGNLGGIIKKDVSISIRNHKDFESQIGFAIGFSRETDIDYMNIEGNIEIFNSQLSNEKYFIRNYNTKPTEIKVKMKGLKMYNNNKRIYYNGKINKFLNSVFNHYIDI